MDEERTPAEIREGVSSGIRSALREDVDRRGHLTAGRLAAAGAIGVAGALGTTLLLSGHPFDHHPPWHVLFFSAAWVGLLVVALALALLDIRTPTLAFGRAASVAVLGLGVAGVCGALCPEPHFLRWWAATDVGSRLIEAGGSALGVACFGFATTAFIALAASVAARRRAAGAPLGALLPAAMLVALLAPGIALQSVGTSWSVFASWLGSAAAGGYLGLAGGLRLRALLGGA